ncbi:MAG TPA: DUF3817 domain-containing protein [Ktedonobacteraceae bacterium]
MQETLQRNERIARRLRGVRVVASIDLVLLVALVSTALARQKALVSILGPLHGINFLLLLVIVALGAIDGVWEWWFPVLVLLTAGPPGAFLGEWLIQRRVRAQSAIVRAPASSGMVTRTIEGVADTSNLPLPSTEEYLLEERKEQV